MPAGNAHRILATMFEAFTPNVGPGLVKSPANAGTITFDKWGQICPVTTTEAWTATLNQPNRAGILAGIVLDADGGDLTLTVTGGYNKDADTSITFDTAGNYIVVWSIKVGTSYYWRVIAQEGTTASVEEGTFDTLTAATLTHAATDLAEHGAGAIGTGVAPVTNRYTRDGVIITEIQIDMTGLASVAAGDDIIGLAAGTPAAYIGKNVVATNGVLYRIEMCCLETPATGDDDINLVSGSVGTENVDDPVTNAAVEINGGDWVAGKSVVQDAPSVTANYWFYLTGGTGEAATYTAGQFIIRLYGHAVLA